MKTTGWCTVAMAMALVAMTGCRSAAPQRSYAMGESVEFMFGDVDASAPEQVSSARMLVWTANLGLEVWNVSNAVEEANALVKAGSGYVSDTRGDGIRSASMTLKVPAKTFDGAVAGLEAIGEIKSKSVSGRDVTEEYVDVEARLKNMIVLRDRLQKLLDKAVDVKDVLAIETELNRVQGEIDSMQARITKLKGLVDFSTINLHLTRKKMLGPAGYVFKGVFWTVEKLFVLRD